MRNNVARPAFSSKVTMILVLESEHTIIRNGSCQEEVCVERLNQLPGSLSAVTVLQNGKTMSCHERHVEPSTCGTEA